MLRKRLLFVPVPRPFSTNQTRSDEISYHRSSTKACAGFPSCAFRAFRSVPSQYACKVSTLDGGLRKDGLGPCSKASRRWISIAAAYKKHIAPSRSLGRYGIRPMSSRHTSMQSTDAEILSSVSLKLTDECLFPGRFNFNRKVDQPVGQVKNTRSRFHSSREWGLSVVCFINCVQSDNWFHLSCSLNFRIARRLQSWNSLFCGRCPWLLKLPSQDPHWRQMGTCYHLKAEISPHSKMNVTPLK